MLIRWSLAWEPRCECPGAPNAPIRRQLLIGRSMAINFKDGVTLGADSRTTTGAYIANRVTDKLTQVHDTIWCCRSGSAADTQAVADIVSYHLNMYGVVNNEAPSTQVAASLFQELCYENKEMLRLALVTTSKTISFILTIILAPESSLPDTTLDTAARSTRYPWVVPYTSSRSRSVVRARPTSTDTPTRTGGSR